MDKLKLVKASVFIMTFVIVFLLCLGITKIVKNQSVKNFEINMSIPEDTHIRQIYAHDEHLFIVLENEQIQIINIKQGKLEGIINLLRRNQDGKE